MRFEAWLVDISIPKSIVCSCFLCPSKNDHSKSWDSDILTFTLFHISLAMSFRLARHSIFFFGALLLLASCVKEDLQWSLEEQALPPTIRTESVSAITNISAMVTGNLESDGGAEIMRLGMCYAAGEGDPDTEDNLVLVTPATGSFNAMLTGLSPDVTYRFRAFTDTQDGTFYGNVLEFTTTNIIAELPVVETAEVENVETTSAGCGGTVTENGGVAVIQRGICFSTSSEPSLSNGTVLNSGSGLGPFTVNLSGLEDGTTYHVRAYATNAVGTAYGQERSFTTILITTPATVVTNNPTNVEMEGATCGGQVTSDGGATVTERGVCIGTNANPTTSNNVFQSGSGVGSFTVPCNGLQAGTQYHVRAYAVNVNGTAYGENKTFTTLEAPTLPTVQTNAVGSIGIYNASASGNVLDDGGLTVTARGFCLATSTNPDLGDVVFSAGSGTGNFSTTLSNLNGGTTYFLRAYATNSLGTSYGQEVNFTTEAPPPSIVSENGATSLGGVTSLYGGMNGTSGSWGIGSSGYSGPCWQAPNPEASGQLGTAIGTHYVEFTHTFQNNGFIEFWLNTYNPGFNNLIPSIAVDGIDQPSPTMIGGGTSGFDWMQVRTADISGGTHTIRITFNGSYYVFKLDEFDFYEYQ